MIASYFLGYILLASIISFALFGIDKRKANNKKRRIAEKDLLISVAAGGRIGGVIGMTYFRHKTLKSSFLRRFWLLTGIWIVATLVIIFLPTSP